MASRDRLTCSRPSAGTLTVPVTHYAAFADAGPRVPRNQDTHNQPQTKLSQLVAGLSMAHWAPLPMQCILLLTVALVLWLGFVPAAALTQQAAGAESADRSKAMPLALEPGVHADAASSRHQERRMLPGSYLGKRRALLDNGAQWRDARGADLQPRRMLPHYTTTRGFGAGRRALQQSQQAALLAVDRVLDERLDLGVVGALPGAGAKHAHDAPSELQPRRMLPGAFLGRRRHLRGSVDDVAGEADLQPRRMLPGSYLKKRTDGRRSVLSDTGDEAESAGPHSQPRRMLPGSYLKKRTDGRRSVLSDTGNEV
jgi:hypothetical protein